MRLYIFIGNVGPDENNIKQFELEQLENDGVQNDRDENRIKRTIRKNGRINTPTGMYTKRVAFTNRSGGGK